jgi:hypothetical protein
MVLEAAFWTLLTETIAGKPAGPGNPLKRKG